MHQGERALLVLLSTKPTTTFERQLLRRFHGVCCAGREAALGTITKLRLDRCPVDAPISQQLFVLTAAHRVVALTLQARQVGQLLRALRQRQRRRQQQQQQQQEEEEQQKQKQKQQQQQQGPAAPSGAVQASETPAAKPTYASITAGLASTTLSSNSGTTSSSNSSSRTTSSTTSNSSSRATTPSTTSSRTNALSTTSSRANTYSTTISSQGTIAAAPGPDEPLLPVSSHPCLTHLIVKGHWLGQVDQLYRTRYRYGGWTTATQHQQVHELLSSLPGGEEITAATVQQVVQLLDILPGTQALQYLLLDDDGRLPSLETDRIGEVQQVMRDGYSWDMYGSIAAAMWPSSSSRSSSSSRGSSWRSRWAGRGRPASSAVGAASSSSSSRWSGGGVAAHASPGNGSSWRHSCHTLLVSTRPCCAWSGICSRPTSMSVGDLQPLLVDLPALRVLGLQGVCADDLATYLPCLQPLRALLLSCTPGPAAPRATAAAAAAAAEAPDVLEVVPGLPNLGHLGIQQFNHDHGWEEIWIPDTFSKLQRLASFHLHDTMVYCNHTPIDLEGLCGVTGLKEIIIWDCPSCNHLPDAISELTGLEWLTLHHTTTAHLPDTITALTGLTGLRWEGVDEWHLRQDLEAVWDLVGLQHLHIHDHSGQPYHEAESPPGDITRLTALTELRWECGFLWSMHEVILELHDSMPQLKVLEFDRLP